MSDSGSREYAKNDSFQLSLILSLIIFNFSFFTSVSFASVQLLLIGSWFQTIMLKMQQWP